MSYVSTYHWLDVVGLNKVTNSTDRYVPGVMKRKLRNVRYIPAGNVPEKYSVSSNENPCHGLMVQRMGTSSSLAKTKS